MHEPQRRNDWSYAPEGEPWSSCAAGDVTPHSWYAWVGPALLLLKDTRRGGYRNTLLDGGSTFVYELPVRPNSGPPNAATSATLAALHREAEAVEKRVEVRVFSVECAKNYYLGEFAVQSVSIDAGHTFVRLRRLREQDPRVRMAYAPPAVQHRSASERRHAQTVAALLPGWHVAHEPECVAFYESELVVGGRMRAWAGETYTCDYVAASPDGCGRVCIESKASIDGLDEAAKAKCRALRDGSLTRVIALIDHGPALRWYDFGAPAVESGEAGATTTAQEAWGSDLVELRGRLGV